MSTGPYIHEDGTVVSSALNVGEYEDAHESVYQQMTLEIGQIEAIHTIENQPKRDFRDPGRNTLFDVRIARANGSSEVIKACKMLQPGFGGGFNNFLEVLPTDPGFAAKNQKISRDLKRGHTVLVGFIGGFRDNAVIIGTMPHPSGVAVAKRPKKSKGVHTEGEIQGLNFQVGNEGQLKIVFNGPRTDSGSLSNSNGPTTIEIDAKGTLTISTNAAQKIRVDRNSKKIRIDNGPTYIDMDQNADKIQVVAKTVEHGTGGLQPHVVGDDMVKWLGLLCTEITKLFVPTGVGPSGNPVNSPAFLALKGQLETMILSKNHKVEK